MGISNEMGHEVILETEAGQPAIIHLGAPDEKIVVLTDERLFSLKQVLEKLRDEIRPQGLIILGATPVGFCAGADINAIKGIKDVAQGEALARQGQEIYDILDQLDCTTVAAVSGACVGGGCELALACTYRVLLDTPSTKIGLPETKLGILPGFGGTQRLPRLIGLPKALDIILQGRVLSARRAYQVGLADEVVSSSGDMEQDFETLVKTAFRVAYGKAIPSRRPQSFIDKLLSGNPVGRDIVYRKVKKEVLKKSKGHYPALIRALDVSVRGMGLTLSAGLCEEAKALGELIATPECKSLVHLYFLTERSSKLGRGAKEDAKKASVAVIGGGVMGAGIAACFLGRGVSTIVVEPVELARRGARSRIESSLGKRRSLSDAERRELLDSLQITDSMDAVASATLVIEAVVEDPVVKHEVFSSIAKLVSKDTVLASNTSSLPIDSIAEGISADPERVIGMHFFNPAEKMPLVEIVRGHRTSERTIVYIAALAAKLGKYPVVVENVPGFLVNRILTPYLSEAAVLISEGIPVEKIDKAAVSFGMPMGPVRLLDEIGLDVAAKVQSVMVESYGERMAGPAFLKKLIAKGRLGKKSRMGFYRFEGKDQSIDDEMYSLLDLDRPTNKSVSFDMIEDRLILSLVNEAVRCLDEHVAGQPGPEAAGQIDLATVMGMGFAPFRGGVIHYADSLGAVELKKKLDVMSELGPRFSACDGVLARAETGKGFSEVSG